MFAAVHVQANYEHTRSPSHIGSENKLIHLGRGGVQFSTYGMLNILNKPFSYVLSRHSLEGDCRKDYTIGYIQCFEGGAAINLHKTLMQACVVANANS